MEMFSAKMKMAANQNSRSDDTAMLGNCALVPWQSTICTLWAWKKEEMIDSELSSLADAPLAEFVLVLASSMMGNAKFEILNKIFNKSKF